MKWIYDSGYHHPLAAYLIGLAFVLVVARKLPFLWGYLFVFTVEILADATATGAWSPVPPDTGAYTFFSVLFIVLGDFRYFFLAERVSELGEPRARFVRVLGEQVVGLEGMEQIGRAVLQGLRIDALALLLLVIEIEEGQQRLGAGGVKQRHGIGHVSRERR